MKPAGYMAKLVRERPGWIAAAAVRDVFSVSGCISPFFADYIDYWRHNGYWLIDSPRVIADIAREHGIDLADTTLFYYEVGEAQSQPASAAWVPFEPDEAFSTHVLEPLTKHLEGFDVVSFSAGTTPECSPLSCNAVASEVDVNEHCLLRSEEEARQLIESGRLENAEPGPYRIVAVYSVGETWPPVSV